MQGKAAGLSPELMSGLAFGAVQDLGERFWTQNNGKDENDYYRNTFAKSFQSFVLQYRVPRAHSLSSHANKHEFSKTGS